MVSQLEAEILPKVTCMVYFEVSMTYSEIYIKYFCINCPQTALDVNACVNVEHLILAFIGLI